MVNSSLPLQGLGLVLLLVGGVMLWGAVTLVVAGALLLAGPELARVDWVALGRAAYVSMAAAGRVGMGSR